MRQPTPHAALRRPDPFVGEWDLWAAGRTVGPFRTEFAWLEGGAFLAPFLHHVGDRLRRHRRRVHRPLRRRPRRRPRLSRQHDRPHLAPAADGEEWTTDFDAAFVRAGKPLS
ncbi:hypothetical protein [Streptomyces viridochromogenes]|uniref:hypothetical protein n=1 Tax=Streptomyces viridochromogenes TaxID=1938 RepID=UPI000B2BF4FA|nr:hypothetical protein [Streptomyces viridochromogenes]